MQPHGSFELAINGQTLIVKAIGAWNYEMAYCMGIEYKRLVEGFAGKPWACLLDLTEWELFTPEANAYIDELNIWGNAHNQRYEVAVCGLAIQRTLIKNTHKVFTHVETKFCDDLQQAQLWLASHGMYPKA